MACPDIKKTSGFEGELSSNHTAKVGNREPPTRTIKELRKAITKEIFRLPVYNFEARNKKLHPPLPRMTQFNPASLSIPKALLPANINPQRDLEYFANFVMRNRMSSELHGDTDPSTEIKRMSKGGHICFSGPAGSGKTTLLRLIARNSAEGFNGYEKVKNVHIVSSQLFRGDSSKLECLARHVLFSSEAGDTTDKITDSESKILFDHACSQPNKYLLIFDSLDTLSQELNEIADPVEEYDLHRKYLPLVHLKMLLRGKLLKGCRVVTSSRPHAIRNFKGDLIPLRVISLLGFSKNDVLEVIKIYSPHNADNIFKTITDRPQFFSLFKEPVFLVYLVEIWQELQSLKYMRATDVLINVVKCFYQNDHAKGNYGKLKNMQKLARENLWRKKLDFDETTLADYSLTFTDLTDLCTNASGKNGRNIVLKLTTKESPFMFSHQSIQEMFAALSIVESKFPKFEEKIRVLHEPFFHKTRDFVYGLTFGTHQNVFSSSVFPAIERKRELLKRSIEAKFHQALLPWEQLAIFETLAEAISDSQRFALPQGHGVILSGIPLDEWSLYSTGIALSQFTVLQILHLENCAIQVSHLRSLEVGTCRYNRDQLQILSFSLNNNTDVGKEIEGVEIACRIVRKCKVNEFSIANCGLNSDSMTEMFHGLSETKVAILVLENNRIGRNGMGTAGQIVKCCSVKDIYLSGCPSTFEEAEAFGKSAKGSDIHRLVAHDRSGKVVSGYGSVIRHCSLKALYILSSVLQPDDANRMKESSSYGKISVLHFTPPPRTGVAPVNEINYDSIINILSLVKDEIILSLPMGTMSIQTLQNVLNNIPGNGPVIKLVGAGKPFTLMSKKQQDLTVEDRENHADEVGCVGGMVAAKDDETVDDEEQKAAVEETAMEMETEYLNISNGSETIAWLKKYKKHPDLISDILAVYGLSIHRHEMNDEDCHLAVEILSHCPQLNRFSFTYSTGIKPLLDALIKVSNDAKMSLPKATNVCFAGYPGIDNELSGQFVQYVKLFKAEGLVLTSVNASHDGLQALKAKLKELEQTGHFKRLEIFHNPDIDERGWKCLADIASYFSSVPLHLSTCYCDLKDDRLLAFKNALKSTKLGKIDICGNRKLTEGGFQTLGEIVKGSEVPSVTVQDCDLDVGKVRGFNSGCGIESPTLEIVSLNVANNPNLGPEGIEGIKKTIQCFRVKNLNIGSCRLDHVEFDHQFESLDISGNPRCSSIPQLAAAVGKWLHMRNCMLSKSELKRLASDLKIQQRKLREIDVSEASKQIDCDDVDFLVEVFKDVTDYITVAENVSIPTSDHRVNDVI